MRMLHVVGIGAGDPDQVTVQAVKAMNTVDVFFVIGKGEQKRELVDIRTRILAEHVTRVHRVEHVEDPPRDRNPDDYGMAVDDWHDARARLLARYITAEPADSVGAILVWGDPSLYDSTIRVVDRVLSLGDAHFEVSVIPGVTSVAALAAAHRMVLNRIGEPVHITTGRQLRDHGLAEESGTAVVMLDSNCEFTALPDHEIWWGANLGTPDAVVRSGVVRDVGDDIVATRAALRERTGWVMDTYALRAPQVQPKALS